MKQHHQEEIRQILGRVKRDEFIGRGAELERLVAHAKGSSSQDAGESARGMLLLLAPQAGVSELLRQAFDELFNRRDVAPIYFALPQAEVTAVSAAIEFLNTFLLQYVAHRRAEPALCQLSLTLDDLIELAPAADLPWIEELVEAYNRRRFGNDDRELVRFCLTAPDRVPALNTRPFVMFDAVRLTNYAGSSVPLGAEIVRALTGSRFRFALAGLRREMVIAVERAGADIDSLATLRLATLSEQDTRQLVSAAARRLEVKITDETRDLLGQQLEGSPFFITAMLQAAREKMFPLDSYLACERLYVDELMGGRLHRDLATVLEHAAPEPETRAALIRLLCEAVPSGNRSASFAAWRKRLRLDGAAVEALLRVLHVQELVNWDGENVDVTGGSGVWRDYLRSRFRLDALREPRALVVADVMADALKRAPQTVARHYRRAASPRLRELLGQFASQRVPQAMFDAKFAASYRGATFDEIEAGLKASAELQLPQVFHVASGVSFSVDLRQFDEESVMVARGFENGGYTDANEVVWLVARVDSKLEADRSLVTGWCAQLLRLAQQSGFLRTQLWLIANEGFAGEAIEALREHNAYGSSRQQFELLSARLDAQTAPVPPPAATEEFELILPMGDDNELLAASAVEQVARRFQFSPDAINQIKTAVVEACINASEHSLSPDRKIYQRFRVESDKLVITIGSRGIVPDQIQGQVVARRGEAEERDQDQRRGWGLELIMTLMDEVEFERVDEGTSLRMTKYRRQA